MLHAFIVSTGIKTQGTFKFQATYLPRYLLSDFIYREIIEFFSRNALTNINKLLSPNGWFLCLFLQSEINFNGFLAASKEEKFSNCLSGIEEIFINAENQKENCNVDLIRNITEDLGLDVKLLELKRHEFDQETRENYKSKNQKS